MSDKDHAGNLELKFYASIAFESSSADPGQEYTLVTARNALRVLMMGWQNVDELMSKRVLYAVFVKRDHALLRAMRAAFQEGFDYLYTSQLKDSHFDELQLNQAQLYMSNCLCLLPFSDITPYESFNIPQYIDGRWTKVDYKVVPIELTATTGFNQLFINDEDRVFAYGLEPISSKDAESHLIFMGTTYPAGQGFLTQIITDSEAFETAGKQLYRTGHKKIKAWIDKQEGNKIHVCGTSLGGALSLILAMHHGDKIARVDALNPPGIYNPWRKSRFDKWDTLKQKPDVYIQRQGNDPVSRFGIWKNDWTLIQVNPPKDKQGPNSLIDHALNYAGLAETQFKYVDVAKDNSARKLQNTVLYAYGRSLLYYLVIVPYHYIINPPLHYLLSHKIEAAIMSAVLIVLLVFPVLVAPVTATFIVLNVILTAIVLGALINLSADLANDIITGKNESTLSQAILWFSKQSTLIKTLSIASLAAVLTLALVIPTIGLISFYAIASMPAVAILFQKTSQIIRTLLHMDEAPTPDYQGPQLPRNKTMDIYNNIIEETFTIKEIGDYYQAKRCLLKNKPLIQESYNKCNVSFLNKLTKKQILEQSADPKHAKDEVILKASKAKIHDIKQTLLLIHRFGFHQPEVLKTHLIQQQQDYALGKQHQKL